MTQPDPHAAITERRDQIASEPRPVPLGDVAEVPASDDLWRVYRSEWVIVYVVDDNPEAQGKIQQY